MCEVRASLAGSIRGATVAVNRDPATLLARIRAGIGSKRDQLKGLAVEPGCKMGQYELVTLRVGNYTVKPRRSTIETLRVSGTSRPNSVAGAIAALLRSEGEVEVQAIGPHAVNQAVKAIAIARSYIEPDGMDLTTKPSFVKLELQSEERTAVRFAIIRTELEEEPDDGSTLAARPRDAGPLLDGDE